MLQWWEFFPIGRWISMRISNKILFSFNYLFPSSSSNSVQFFSDLFFKMWGAGKHLIKELHPGCLLESWLLEFLMCNRFSACVIFLGELQCRKAIQLFSGGRCDGRDWWHLHQDGKAGANTMQIVFFENSWMSSVASTKQELKVNRELGKGMGDSDRKS